MPATRRATRRATAAGQDFLYALSARPRFGQAIGRADPVAQVSELAALAGSSRLRDYEAPRKDLPELAQAIVEFLAAKATPRPPPGSGAQAAGGDLGSSGCEGWISLPSRISVETVHPDGEGEPTWEES